MRPLAGQDHSGSTAAGLPDDTAARALKWSTSDGGHVSARVFGGAYRVDIEELHRLAAQLDHGAECLQRARDQVRAVMERISSIDLISLLTAGMRQPEPWDAPQLDRSPMPQAYGGYLGQTGPTPHLFGALNARYTQARIDLQALLQGPHCLEEVSAQLRQLAQDVRQAALGYEHAHTQAAHLWAVDIGIRRSFSRTLITRMAPGFTLLAASRLLGAVMRLSGRPQGLVGDVLEHLGTILSDSHLAPWVSEELLAIVAVGYRAAQASSGEEVAELEEYLRQASARLDPHIIRELPPQLPIGSRTVETASLTPMQRVSTYLAILASQAGARRYGERIGIKLTPHSGSWRGPDITMPPVRVDAYGLATPLLPLAALAGAGRKNQAGGAQRLARIAPPATPSDVMRYSDSLKKRDTDISTGVMSIVKTEHADGTRSWLVVVPGTTHWDAGGSNPQDMLTNLEAVARRPTDMESAVVSAMRAAGIEAGEKVAFYGHSQGAITVANLVSDPGVHERFTVTAALTVGGPIAGAPIPASVAALHIENGADAVTALDAGGNPVSPNRITVVLDTSRAQIEGYPHGSLIYAQVLEGMPHDPALAAWSSTLASITGAHEEGAETSEVIFDIERLTQPRP